VKMLAFRLKNFNSKIFNSYQSNENRKINFWYKTPQYFPETYMKKSKLQGKPPALSKDSAALQNMISLFLFGHTRSGSEFRIRVNLLHEIKIQYLPYNNKGKAGSGSGTVQNEQSMGTWLR
jgi:hypothetical protein